MKTPRIIIAGTNSGCGKTTVTMGIMSALIKKRLKVQPFKVGPDYIDPMFHSFITNKPSRNLDSWLLDESTVSYLFQKNSNTADISVIEGVMGLFDGFGGNSLEGSTAHVAKILKAPIILVVNGEGMSLSIAALIKGFKDFDNEVAIKGIIINNINTESHFNMLKEIIEENTGITVVGYLPRTEEYSLSSRHLGLIPSGEIEGLKDKLNILSENIQKTIDLELLLNIANEAEELIDTAVQIPLLNHKETITKPRIAVPMDKAFNFYYRDNLDLLESLGAELVYFSPIKDNLLPDNIHGLYIGGGFPEVWAKELENNVKIRKDIKSRIENNLPTYAECGGFMYLCESIKNLEGNLFEMVGIIRGKSEMTEKLQRFGYMELEIPGESLFSQDTCKVKAHEFHYSTTKLQGDFSTAFKVMKQGKNKNILSWNCGYKINNLMAGYPHIHFGSNPDLAKGFINSCIKFKNDMESGRH